MNTESIYTKVGLEYRLLPEIYMMFAKEMVKHNDVPDGCYRCRFYMPINECALKEYFNANWKKCSPYDFIKYTLENI